MKTVAEGMTRSGFKRDLLWWGRGDAGYSRNKIILGLLKDIGWRIACYRPAASLSGTMEAFSRRLKRPDLVWVPCFRQRDIRSAAFWCRRWSVPLVVDPLISAYEKEVFEKLKYPPGSRQAEKLRRWESGLFAGADLVIADTPAHAGFFSETLSVSPKRLKVIPVGAESHVFRPDFPAPEPRPPYEVLFYGSFLSLQGVDIIVQAAGLCADDRVRWVLLGDGNLRKDIEKTAKGNPYISFEPWMDYQNLPQRLSRAHILLGIFGTTPKANLVIPNKVYQAMAMAKPLITRKADAYPSGFTASEAIGWVDAGDPKGLAHLVLRWLAKPEKLVERGKKGRELFDTYVAEDRLRRELEAALEAVAPKLRPLSQS